MFKDFNADGPLIIDNALMTNGDTPLLAVENIIQNPSNPLTGVPLKTRKEKGVTM
jgi:hypothetical protein